MKSSLKAFLLWAAILWTVVQYSYGKLVERKTIYGKVRGFDDSLTCNDHKVEAFLGIPYAKPPIGNLRFEAPVAPEKWTGVRTAYELSPACPQTRSGVDYIQYHVPEFNKTSEDCLYLNIFVPKTNHHPHQRHDVSNTSRKGHAVIVFVHGGSYTYGMGAMMDGRCLATHDVIFITFNYRLGALGFLEAGDEIFPGNYGLLDQVAALRWVQDNIHYFGGDPSRVTIDGHSAGGCSVGLLMLMPIAKGLFTRVIQQSGSPFANWAVARQPGSQNFFFKLFATTSGCYGNSTKEVKACLKELSSEKIQMAIDELIVHPISMVPIFRPTVDGHILPDTPEKLASYGDINGRQILTGTTTDEGLEAAFVLFNQIGKNHSRIQHLLAVLSSFSIDLPDIRSLIGLRIKGIPIERVPQSCPPLSRSTGFECGIGYESPLYMSSSDVILEQYFRSPHDMSDDDLKEGFAEIVGDYFITAPTHMTANLLSSRNITVYLYNYNYFSVNDPWFGAKHGAELFYLSGFPLTAHVNFKYDEKDKDMAITLMKLWSSFAQSGVPNLLLGDDDFHMPPYTPSTPTFTLITSRDPQTTLSVQTSYKQDKMAFWNQRVPKLYMDQLRADVHLINDTLNYELKHVYQNSGLSKGNNEDIVRKSPAYIISHSSGSWILIAACIGLCTLTVLLSVCYCQVKRQVKSLIRQTSISSGEPILS